MIENIHKRETESTYNIDGREFVIKSYDPMEGNYILTQVIQFVLPFGITDMLISSVVGTEKQNVLGATNKPMSKSDFMALQVDILKTVYERFNTGEESPVVRDNGTYGVVDVTMNMLLKLLIASLAFNFKDFFKGVPSEDSIIDNLASKFAATKT